MVISILRFLFTKSFSFIFWAKFCPKIWSSADWLIFGTEIGYHIIISILYFIFSKFFLLIYLGQIWSKNLKFFKLTEIWLWGRWPCAYLHFNVEFLKSFSFIFWDKFGPKIWSCSDSLKFGSEIDYHILISILMFLFSKLFSFTFLGQFWSRKWTSSNWLKFGTEVDHHVLISILMGFFFKFSFHSSFFWQIWSQNLKFFRLTEKWHRDRLPYTYFDFNVYFFKIFGHPYFLWENLVPQKHTFAKLIEIWSSGTLYMLILTLTFIITKFFSFIFLGQIWSQNPKFFRLTELWYKDRLTYTYFHFNVYFLEIFVIHIFLMKIWSRKRRRLPN